MDGDVGLGGVTAGELPVCLAYPVGEVVGEDCAAEAVADCLAGVRPRLVAALQLCELPFDAVLQIVVAEESLVAVDGEASGRLVSRCPAG